MKLNFPLSIAIGINKLFFESSDSRLQVQLNFLKELGYKGIELALLRPEGVSVEKMNSLLDENQMKVSALGTGSTYLRYGYSICSSDEKIRNKAIERVELYCKLASELNGLPKVVLGLIRGRRLYNQSRDTELSLFKHSLIRLDGISERYGTELIIEPINQFEVDFLHTLPDVIELLQDLNLKNTFTMIDSFHVYLEENRDTFFDILQEFSSYIHHVHFAGPDRRAPKNGGIDYKRIVQTLMEKKYEGFFSIEAISKPSFEYLAKESMLYLSSLF